MEKTISQEERIRRAEEIYYRRRNNRDVRVSSSSVKASGEKRTLELYKKMILQMIICTIIYLIFYLIKNTNYLFSEDVLNNAKRFLSADINFESMVQGVQDYFNENEDKFGFWSEWLKKDENEDNSYENNNEKAAGGNNEDAQANIENNEASQNGQTSLNQEGILNEPKEVNSNTNGQENSKSNSENNTNAENKQAKETTNTDGKGGTKDEDKTILTSASGTSSKTQAQKDAEYIKKNFKFSLPVKGTVTSRYGEREPTEIISANHQGIDIGVDTGTTIVAAMEGKASVVSKEGDYGIHVKIVNKDITTIYAHCSKILVKEGATIKQGQKIAISRKHWK